eukprot:maker-scaffold953_size76948-snap-gene-0.7 protein:Tk11424 transcript:maker-scaffold953_size76948-snap-gene-0.7-mRNA-1 annotation:"conserved hypothetical protein"
MPLFHHVKTAAFGLVVLMVLIPLSSCAPDEDPEDGRCGAANFDCPKPNGNFADPCECRRFYVCNGFQPTQLNCPARLYWDDRKKECTYESEAECGPIESTTEKIPEEFTEASTCDKSSCSLPYCFCSQSGTEPPLDVELLPQFVLLMIDGAINTNNFHFYSALLNNSDFEPSKQIKATFFVQHEYCDYYMVESLYTAGHEIALSSVTGQVLQRANVTAWTNELESLRNILVKYGKVPFEDLLGVRAPRVRPGYNHQYDALVKAGFVWDSSVSTLPLDVPVWPYTLDQKIPHDCRVTSCPSKSYPGLWELPLNSHYIESERDSYCTHLDQCVFNFQSGDDIFEWLKEDFARHYETNRAPYHIPVHTNWFLNIKQIQALNLFVEWLREKSDVFFVTGTELLLWLTDENINKSVSTQYIPPPLLKPRQLTCNKPQSCEVPHSQGSGITSLRYMKTCNQCPEEYPWLESAEDL